MDNSLQAPEILSPEEAASLQRGLDDAAAGRVEPLDESLLAPVEDTKPGTSEDIPPMTFEDTCEWGRQECLKIEKTARNLMGSLRFILDETFSGQHSEIKAQLMLTVRHLEDARMRFGKALQYASDGISILDKK